MVEREGVEARTGIHHAGDGGAHGEVIIRVLAPRGVVTHVHPTKRQPLPEVRGELVVHVLQPNTLLSVTSKGMCSIQVFVANRRAG